MDKAKDDFESASDEMDTLLDRFEAAGYNSGAAMGFMGSCMSTAALMATSPDETEH